MRVINLINNYSQYSGGAERLVRGLHLGLLKRQWESSLLGLMKQRDSEVEQAASLGLDSPYGLKALIKTARWFIRNSQPDDIVHTHLFPANLYGSVLKRLGIIKGELVTTEHNTTNRRRGKVWGKWLDYFIYKPYSKIYAISEGTKDELLIWLPSLEARIEVIYNGVVLPFKQIPKREPKETPVILTVGSLTKQKNIDTVLNALILIKNMNFNYLIAGEGEEMDKLMKQCKIIHLEEKVEFLGYVVPIKPLLVQADIFLMPSRWEGFGMAAVEAMNAGLPLVVSDVPGLKEVVDGSKQCAIFVDPDKPEMIADAIAHLLQHPNKGLELGENAFQQARKFREDEMISKYIQAYLSLAKIL